MGNCTHKSDNHDVFIKADAPYICLVNFKKNQIMKTTFKNSLVVIAMLGVITSYANLIPSNPKNEGVRTTILTFDNVRQGQRLIIKSSNGTILYKEAIAKTGDYRKEFDLTSLPNGNYFFELEKDLEIQIIPFEVAYNKVEFAKEKEVIIFKPHVRNESNKLFLTRLSFDLMPLNIEIYYDGNEFDGYKKIFMEKVEGTKIIERIYSLDTNKKGNYKIVMKTQGSEFTQIFTI